jgi:hypothetical protein
VILGRFVVTFVSSLDRQEDEIVRFVNLWRSVRRWSEKAAAGTDAPPRFAGSARSRRGSRKHKLRRREGDSAWSHDPAALNFSWRPFHSRSAWLRRPGRGTSWKMLPLPLIRRATISSPTLWQSDQVSWINSSNRQAVWKRALVRWNARAEP